MAYTRPGLPERLPLEGNSILVGRWRKLVLETALAAIADDATRDALRALALPETIVPDWPA